MTVRGVLQIHSAPPALGPHIEWAVAGVSRRAGQPAMGGAACLARHRVRTELDWQGPPGTGGAITSALATWNLLRFEVTEEASPGCDAVRYSYTPTLGMFSASIAANGDIMIPENRLRAVLAWPPRAARSRRWPRLAADNGDSVSDLRDTHGPRHPALGGSLEEELCLLLGDPWDDELEPFRHAAAGAPVRWLHATG